MKIDSQRISIFASRQLTKVPAQSLSAAEVASRRIAAVQGTSFIWNKKRVK